MYAILVFDRHEGATRPLFEDRQAGQVLLFFHQHEAEQHIRETGLSTQRNQDCDHGQARFAHARVVNWDI